MGFNNNLLSLILTLIVGIFVFALFCILNLGKLLLHVNIPVSFDSILITFL